MPDLLSILNQRFGLSGFRPSQEEIIRHVLLKGSGLVLMPTGSGKSLCYQLPSTLLPGLTLVISPLIALAHDQVVAARQRGLAATEINSSVDRDERHRRWQKVKEGEIKLLYITPERLKMPEFSENVRPEAISLLAVDEAHCLSQWGHDFRPEYARLGERRLQMGDPPTLALTATATPMVQDEIRKNLRIENDPVWDVGLERANLHLQVFEVHGLDDKVRSFVALRHLSPGPMIAYFSLVGTLEKFSQEIDRLNLPHVVYHGSVPDRQRREQQRRFQSGESNLILATPAFGLGIDKSDVRSVVHMELPGSIEAYFQEIGRAGRDGKPAKCTLLYDPDDVSIQMDFLKWTNPDPEFIRATYKLIKNNTARVQAEGADFLRGQLLFHHRRDFRLETALNHLERWDSIEWPHHDFRGIKALGEPDGEWLDEDIQKRRHRGQSEKLLQLVRWVGSEDCRLTGIYDYFGHRDRPPCGVCDNCIAAVES